MTLGRRRRDQTALFRALRPLKRSCSRARRAELDERGTAEKSADAGSLVLSFRQREERWVDLAVLIDVSASMVIWQDAVDELLGVLTRLGAFRDVAAWAFDADAADPGFRPFRRGTAVRRGSASAAEALTKTPGPHAFLVISDGVGQAWRNATLANALSRLARQSTVSLVNPLPHRMWHRSRIRTQLMYQQVTGATDTLAIRQYRTPWSPPEPRQWVPVWRLAADELGAWARLMAGTGDRTQPGLALVVGPSRSAETRRDGPAAAGSPAEAVALFRASTSSAAFRLATRLAAVPLSLPVIRMVRDTIAGDEGTDLLAEVLLSGLLVRTSARSTDEDPDQVVYDFSQGVREHLLGSLTRTEVLASLQTVALAPDPVARPFGGTLNFRLLTDPDGGARPLPEQAKHFASVAAMSLGSLGAAYADLTSSITARLDSGTAESFRVIRDSQFPPITGTLTIVQVDGPARLAGDGTALADLLADRIEADRQAQPDVLVACENLVSAPTTVEVARSAAFFGRLLARLRLTPDRLIIAPSPVDWQSWGAYEHARVVAGRATTGLLEQAVGCPEHGPDTWWQVDLTDQVAVTVLDSTQVETPIRSGALGERQLAWLGAPGSGGRLRVVVMHHDPASRLLDTGAFYDALPERGLVLHGWGPSASATPLAASYADAPAIPDPDAGFLVYRIDSRQVAIRGRQVFPEPASGITITSSIAFSASERLSGGLKSTGRQPPVQLFDAYTQQQTAQILEQT